MLTAKPGRCKFCRKRMETIGQKIHPDCAEAWWSDQKDKIKAKAARDQERRDIARDRLTRENQKTIPKLRAEAQVEFNRYIRARDEELPCISCGKPPGDLSGLHAGRDAGHYRSTGAASHLRFDERNCHAQCVHCNQYLAGNSVQYRISLLERIGPEAVASLEADNDPVKWTKDVLRQIKVAYRAKTRELMKK